LLKTDQIHDRFRPHSLSPERALWRGFDGVRCAGLLKNGRLSGRSEKANAVLGGMFMEVEPRLIARCALEAQVTIKQANLLYLDTVAHAFPKCQQWESAVEYLV